MSLARSTNRKSSAKSTRGKSSAKKATVKKTSAKKATVKKTSAKKTAAMISDDLPHPTVRMCELLAATLDRYSLTELIVDSEELSITMRKESTMLVAEPQPPVAHGALPPVGIVPTPEVSSSDSGLHVITSPFVGTFYRSPSPDASPYCEIGQTVELGQVLCIVEAMKLMNEIESDTAGTLEAILVDNGSPLEYGQPLFKIRV